jgi:hypothetical protein
MTIVESTLAVIGDVDTHLDVHVAAAVDAEGGVLDVESFPSATGWTRRSSFEVRPDADRQISRESRPSGPTVQRLSPQLLSGRRLGEPPSMEGGQNSSRTSSGVPVASTAFLSCSPSSSNFA